MARNTAKLKLGKILNMTKTKNLLPRKKMKIKSIQLVNSEELTVEVDLNAILNLSQIQNRNQFLSLKNLVKVMPANAKNGNNKRRKLQKTLRKRSTEALDASQV